MQKDFHYYLTFALAIKAGIEFETAQAIAWSNQFTDDCKDFERYGIRTMVDITWKVSDCFVPEVQRSVFVPFHFLPCGMNPNPFIVFPLCGLAETLIDQAINDPFGLGITLHSLQDTYSHIGFSGMQDDINAKHPWDLTSIIAPRIGHAEFGRDPDIIFDGRKIDNRIQFKKALARTFEILCKFNGGCKYEFEFFELPISHILNEVDYDKRKQWIMDWAEISDEDRYSTVEPPKEYTNKFTRAARKQLSIAQEYISKF